MNNKIGPLPVLTNFSFKLGEMSFGKFGNDTTQQKRFRHLRIIAFMEDC